MPAPFSNDFKNIVEFYLEAARGNVEGVRTIHKFGLAESLDTADGKAVIWDGVATDIAAKIIDYNWFSTPRALEVTSTDVLDTTVSVEVTGLNEDGIEVTEVVQLNGQTPVLLNGTNFTAVNTARTRFGEALGNIYVFDAGTSTSLGVPVDNTTVRALIHQEKQRTQMALYTVPSNEVLYIAHGWCHLSKAITTEAVIEIYRQPVGDAFQVVHTIGLSTNGSSGDHRPYNIPIRFEPGERLVYRVTALANNTSVSAGFHGILIKE